MNKYEVLGVVGEGAYGVVLKCKNKETNEYGSLITHSFPSGHQEVQGNRRRRSRQKEHPAGSEDAQNPQAPQHCVAQGGLQKVSPTPRYHLHDSRKGRIYLVFEFVEKNLLEVLESKPNGLDVTLLFPTPIIVRVHPKSHLPARQVHLHLPRQ